MSLDKKYRPSSLDQIYGNESLVIMIDKLIKRKKNRPQTILLQGARGCGKTTLARIMAKEFGGVGADIKELNISSMRGIDTARKVIENVGYRSLEGESKVIILNECHKATSEFQNAMLEKLEEPPKNVYFILCTTEPEKLLETVKSRCVMKTFTVKPLTRRQLINLIEEVLKEEGIDFPSDYIRKVANISQGIPREALLLLDTLIDLDKKELQKAVKDLHSVTKDKPIDLARAINKQANWKEIKLILKDLATVPAEDVRRVILDYMWKVLLDRGGAYHAHVIECFEYSFLESGMAGLVLACWKAVQPLSLKE